MARAQANLAHLLRLQGRSHEAAPLYRNALEQLERLPGGSDHADYATMLNNLGRIRAAERDWKSARRLHERAIAALVRRVGPDDPLTALALVNLGDAFRAAGRLSRAAPLFERALAIDRARYGDEHVRVAEDLEWLGDIETLRKRYGVAQPLLERALELNRKLNGGGSAETARCAAKLGQLHSLANRPVEAAALLASSLRTLEQSWGRDDHRLLAFLPAYHRALRSLGDHAEAARVEVWGTRIRFRAAHSESRPGAANSSGR